MKTTLCTQCRKLIQDDMLDLGSSLCEPCFDAEYQEYLDEQGA